MKLDDLIPGVSTAKLIAWALGGLALLGLVLFGWFTVRGWRDDAARLPVVQAQLEQSQADNKVLTARITTDFQWIAARIDANAARAQGVTGQVAANQAGIASDINAFLKRFNNAPPNPACDVPESVRDGLLRLFPLYRAAGPAAPVGGTGSDGQGQSSDPAGGAAPVPGRQQSENHGGKMGLSTAAGSSAGASERDVDGDRRAPDRGAAGGNGSPGPDEQLGSPGPGIFQRAWRAVTGALTLAGAAAVEVVQDDRRDGR